MAKLFRSVGTFALAGLISIPAQAGTMSVSDIFSQFNAVVFKSFNTTSDVAGRTVIGGNLIGSNSSTFYINPQGEAASSFGALSVYGSVTSTATYNVNNGGSVNIHGSNRAGFSFNNGGTAYIGGSNSGNLTLMNGAGSLTIGKANSGTLQVAGGSVYLGGNSGNLTANGNAAVSINGNNAGQIILNSGGSVALKGNTSAPIIVNGGGSVRYSGTSSSNGSKITINGQHTGTHVSNLVVQKPASTLSSFATTFKTPLTDLSKQLNTLTANSVATVSGNAVTFKATPSSSGGVAVFDFTASLLNNASTVTIDLGNASSAIINVNVAGSYSFPSGLNFQSPTSYAGKVLWNFINASAITFGTEFGGSVLAPNALVTNNSPIDGTLIASAYKGNGELHNYSYTGSLSLTQGSTGTGSPTAGGSTSTTTAGSAQTGTAVPEPTSLLLLSGGVGALGYLRRRHPLKTARRT